MEIHSNSPKLYYGYWPLARDFLDFVPTLVTSCVIVGNGSEARVWPSVDDEVRTLVKEEEVEFDVDREASLISEAGGVWNGGKRKTRCLLSQYQCEDVYVIKKGTVDH